MALAITTLGRVLRFAGFAKLKIEARDRTTARTGPHSRLTYLPRTRRRQYINIEDNKCGKEKNFYWFYFRY